MTIGTSGVNRHPSGAHHANRHGPRRAGPQTVHPAAVTPTVPPGLVAWINRVLDVLLKGLKDDAYIH